MERVWPNSYANHAEAARDLTDYIVGFYNSTRLHSTLGYLPPNSYETKMAARQPIEVFKITLTTTWTSSKAGRITRG